MSFLNVRRLVSPRLNVWKSLRNKVQKKILRLNRSKAIIQKRAKMKNLRWPFFSIQKKKLKVMKPKHHALIHLNKIRPPVYVDPLFVKQGIISSPVAAIARESNYYKNYRGKSRSKEATSIRSDDDDDDDDDDDKSEIDERAEEFINRFRAQMHHQEMLARHL